MANDIYIFLLIRQFIVILKMSNNQEKQMSYWKIIVKACDLFSFQKFLRFKKEDQLKTITGGVFSIILIVIFLILFSNSLFSAINRQKPIVNIQNYRPDEPISLGYLGQDKFQLAVGMESINLLQLPSFFQIQLWTKVIQRGKLISQTQYYLEPCKRQLWSLISEQAAAAFDDLNMSDWLCLPPSLSFELSGSNSGQKLTYAQLIIVRCNASKMACAGDAQIENFVTKNQQFTMKVYFSNPNINPSKQNYMSYYMDDNNHYPFTHKTGFNANLYFAQYSIVNDDSLMPEPSESISQKKGIIFDGTLDAVKNFDIDSNIFARIALRKSSASTRYLRSFRRLDDLLSYIGGLFGFLMILMIMIKKYNEYSFKIELACEISKFSDKQQIKANWFNFLTYIKLLCFKLISVFSPSILQKWPECKKYDQCQQQIQEQLSIDYLLKRITFLQKVIELSFEDQDFEGIKLDDKIDLSMLKIKRTEHDNHKTVREQLNKTIKRTVRLQSSSPQNEQNKQGQQYSPVVQCFRPYNSRSRSNKIKKNYYKASPLQDIIEEQIDLNQIQPNSINQLILPEANMQYDQYFDERERRSPYVPEFNNPTPNKDMTPSNKQDILGNCTSKSEKIQSSKRRSAQAPKQKQNQGIDHQISDFMN